MLLILIQIRKSGLLILLAEDDGCALNNENTSQDNKSDGPDHLEPVTPQSGAANNHVDLADDGDDQRGDGGSEHEEHGEDEHLVVLANVSKPSSNSQHSNTSEELVGSAEHAPDLAQAHEAHAAADNDHNEGTDQGVREELGSAGQVVAGLSFGNEELGEEVTGETGTGVERGQSKDGNGEGEEGVDSVVHGVGEVSNAAEHLSDHGSNTTGEDGGRSGEEELVAAADVGLLEENANSDQSNDSESGLDDHGTVADDLSILLGVELLGSGAGADEGMEAGDSAASNGDEQNGEEVGVAVDTLPAGEGGEVDLCAGADDTDESDDHHTVEQEGGQVVTGLEKNPDGQQRSEGDVHSDEDDPEGTTHVEADVQTGEGDEDDTDDANDGGGADGSVLAVHEETEDDSDNDEEQGGGSGGSSTGNVGTADSDDRVSGGSEGTSNNSGEGGNDEDENEQCEDGEQALSSHADVGLDDFADGTAVVADGGEQSTKVMHCAEEDTTDDNPQENGNPAEDSGLDRSVDGACASDGREMVTHQNGGVSRNEVLTVVTGVCRGLMVGVNAPLLCQPRAVENVAQSKQSDCDNENDNCAHTFHSLNKNVFYLLSLSSFLWIEAKSLLKYLTSS